MAVTIDKECMVELAKIVSTAVVEALKDNNIIGSAKAAPAKSEKTAYQKTEQLLYNYMGFKRIVQEKMDEIADLRRYGVPQKSGGMGERVQGGNLPSGIVLPEESVEAAVRSVQASVQGTVQVISMMDKCMAALQNDPYYDILPMRYFKGRTLEDIGVYLGYDHSTISRNKNRLVKELAMRLFPDEVVHEFMK